jgi:hypothetical protein
MIKAGKERATASRAILVVTLDADSYGSPGAKVIREPGRTAHPTARSQAPVAQRIEQQPSNLSVVGSSPTGGANIVVLLSGCHTSTNA